MLTLSQSVFCLIIIGIIPFPQVFANIKLSCLGNGAVEVNWWFGIKYPGNVSSENPQFAYIDSTATQSELSIISGTIDSIGHSLYDTVNAINALPLENLSILVYNDQPPNQEFVPIGAHAKGIVAWDAQTESGVYIMHSAPEYPTVSKYGYIEATLPDNTDEYGQNFLCINLNQESLNVLTASYRVTDPVIYYYSGIFLSNYSSTKNFEVQTFTLASELSCTILSKNPNYEGYLYEAIIEPYFKANMMVESWGRPYQNSECPPRIQYESLNVEYVKLPNGEGWDHYSDHSKWGVVYGRNIEYGCSCDMNRMESQISRGGSCICFTNNPTFSKGLHDIIKNVEKCDTDAQMNSI